MNLTLLCPFTIFFPMQYTQAWASSVAHWQKSACSTGDAGDLGLIPGSGRPPGAGHGSILAWRIPWTEEPGGLQSKGSQRPEVTEHTHMHTHTCIDQSVINYCTCTMNKVAILLWPEDLYKNFI